MAKVVNQDVNLNIRISRELRDKLHRVAQKNGVKGAQIIRECIKRLEE